MSIAPPTTVLVVEDDRAIRRGIVDALAFAGFRTLDTEHGDQGADMALTRDPDLVLLDLALPGLPGMTILRRIRESKPTLPVIILTARGNEPDRIAGLEAGADDYVVKPFSMKELLARVGAVLRRSCTRPGDVTTIDLPAGVADLERREFRDRDGGRSELSDRECRLLRYLAANPGRAIDRRELLENVWGLDPRGLTTRTIDMHIARLREKLGDDAEHPVVLLTVRGKGYMFGLAANRAGED
jgi:DNA-binding response OmpR family regulator